MHIHGILTGVWHVYSGETGDSDKGMTSIYRDSDRGDMHIQGILTEV